MALPTLSPDLAERLRWVAPRAEPADGGFVLYWLRVAQRAHENPALDAALELGEALGRPVFVYHALSERHPFANDRHHTFILEGARDVARQMERRGVGYAFHLERPGHRGPWLRDLASRASVVVTEEMPVAPLAGWTERLAADVRAPVASVDASCVVPMPLFDRPFDRAFRFRQATAARARERTERPWRDRAVEGEPFVPDLPFAPVGLASASIAGLVAECEIDHSVAPVPGTRGGSAAGYSRWDAFRENALGRYARDRNDPLRDGVSRMSPYLHYGMVSSLRIAREARAKGGPGAEKFLDELLVWRELAWHFCFHEPAHATVAALPAWARETLEGHEGDERPALPSWETLARARTGDTLWDVAQRSLLVHGELHNNVRMTWGKALLGWTPDAATALARLEDLNHRYALDGRDPASYGGLLWCLGLFDRPFDPEKPIFGRVRPRSASVHARRLDPASWGRHLGRSALSRPPRVLVVGAGVAGSACARTLADHGLEVVAVDKGRGPGGRASTRRTEDPRLGSLAFDHGAQYFTVRDRRIRPFLESWLHDGVVARWTGRVGTLGPDGAGETDGAVERYVGVPGMNALVAHLQRDLEVRFGTRVTAVERRDGRWLASLEDGETLDGFDILVVALPVPQVLDLLAEDELPAAERDRLEAVRMKPCWAALVAFDEPLDAPFDGAFVDSRKLSWVARNSSKPGRPRGDAWVLHAPAAFTRETLERPADEVGGEMLAELLRLLRSSAAGRLVACHRWLYAGVEEGLGREALFVPEFGLGLAGDALPGGRVEGALVSGLALAGRVLGHAAETEPEGFSWRRPSSNQNLGLFD